MAAIQLRKERSDHTLQPTALVNEAYVRLAGNRDKEYKDRSHFLAAAAHVMHCVLVDYARARKAGKRFGNLRRVELNDAIPSMGQNWSEQMLAFEEALAQLKQFDPKGAQVMECRIFAGMTFEEIAEVMGRSTRMVKRYNNAAAAWLMSRLRDFPSDDEADGAGVPERSRGPHSGGGPGPKSAAAKATAGER